MDELEKRADDWIVGKYRNSQAVPEADKIIRELLVDRSCLKIQVVDRGESFTLAKAEEIKTRRRNIELIANVENCIAANDAKLEKIQRIENRIDQAIKRIEETLARDGGPAWHEAKKLLKGDLDLILDGLKS
ncbi:hypothetical protein CCP3SC15_360007 [Gammaproteobacteria bacterium]